MNRWINGMVDRVTVMAAADEHYRDVLALCEIMERDYLRIMKALPKADRIKVDEYIALCKELQYRMTQLAYELGLKEGEGKLYRCGKLLFTRHRIPLLPLPLGEVPQCAHWGGEGKMVETPSQSRHSACQLSQRESQGDCVA